MSYAKDLKNAQCESVETTIRKVLYDVNTGTGHFGKFGTAPIPIPPVPV